MNRIGALLKGAVGAYKSCISPRVLLNDTQTRSVVTTKRLLGLDEFFEQGKSLPIYEPGKAPSYGNPTSHQEPTMGRACLEAR